MATDLTTTDDPEPIYAHMRPDQRTAIGEEFILLLRMSDDPEARRLADEVASTFAVPATMLSPAQVAVLHRYAQAHHPEIFAAVMQHEVTASALGGSRGLSPEQRARSDLKRSTHDGEDHPHRDEPAA